MKRGTKRGGARLLASGVAASLVLSLAACGAGSDESSDEPAAFSGHQIEGDERYTPAEVTLRDTSGAERTLDDNDGDLTLVFFGYTNCPDICGIVMSTVASAVNKLDAADRERVDMVFVTTDPARDDEKVLRSYLDRYDPAFEGLTGDMDDILAVGTSMKVHIEDGQKLPTGGYEVVHGDQVFGLDAEGRGASVWMKETSSAEMAADIKSLLAD